MLTLPDFLAMEIIERPDGTKTPLVDIECGHAIGLIGYNADLRMTDEEIKMDAFAHYMLLLGAINQDKN